MKLRSREVNLAAQEKTAVDPAQRIERQVDTTEKKSRKRKRTRVTVFANWCKGCGLCVAFCPQGVFEEDEESHPIVAHPERCTGCDWCTMHCPDFAIVVHVEDEPQTNCGVNEENGEDSK